MPKQALAASLVIKGGYGARRSAAAITKTGRARCSPRWTASAAIAASEQVHAMCQSWGKTRQQVIEWYLANPERAARFAGEPVMRNAPKQDRDTVRMVFMDKAQKVQQSGKLESRAQTLRERMRAHSGPTSTLTRILTSAEQAVAPQAKGWWLDTAADASRPRRAPPHDDSRPLRLLKSWRMSRLGALPDYAVVCIERANDRIRTWRKRHGMQPSAAVPPAATFLRTLVHTEVVPTVTGNDADHPWLPALNRWVSPSEMARLFGVRESDALFATLTDGTTLDPAPACTALGRAVHAQEAERAMHMAMAHVLDTGTQSHTGVLRYASACSGLDMFATALDRVAGTQWQYVCAAEQMPLMRSALARTYAARGLTASRIAHDATQPFRHVADIDIWTISPPCTAFSRANRHRTAAKQAQALADMHAMFRFAADANPTAVVVENVGEKEARACVTAAVLTIPGYTWSAFKSNAAAHGDMEREREFWVGKRA